MAVIGNKTDKVKLQQAIIDSDIQLTATKVSLAEYLTRKYGNLPQAKPQWIEALKHMSQLKFSTSVQDEAVKSVLTDLEAK